MPTLTDLARAVEPHVSETYEAGAIVYNSWGYDQTNIDFYVIVKRTGDWISLVPMSATSDGVEVSFMSYKVTPDEVRREAKPFRRKIARGERGEIGVSIDSYGWCSLWDGSPKTTSHYA